MSDTTWGVKVSEELKERMAKAQQQSNLTGKEFLELLLQSYQIGQFKNSQPIIAPDINELQIITNRINVIFVNMVDRINSMLRTNELEFANQLEAKERLAKALDDKCTEFEGNYQLLQQEYADLVARNDELRKSVMQIEEVATTNKELVAEYKVKNEYLTDLLCEYKKFEDMVNKRTVELETERQKTREIIEALQECKKESNNLKNKITDMEVRFRNENEQLNLQHHLEIERVTLEIRAEYQKKNEQSANEYQKNTTRLQEEHNNRIQALLDKISEIQNSRNSKKGPRQSNAASE